MPAVDGMKVVAARRSDLTYYGQQRCAACRGVCRAGGASLQEDGGSAECRAVVFNNWVDDDERLKWSRRQSSRRPAKRSMTTDFFFFFFCCREDKLFLCELISCYSSLVLIRRIETSPDKAGESDRSLFPFFARAFLCL